MWQQILRGLLAGYQVNLWNGTHLTPAGWLWHLQQTRLNHSSYHWRLNTVASSSFFFFFFSTGILIFLEQCKVTGVITLCQSWWNIGDNYSLLRKIHHNLKILSHLKVASINSFDIFATFTLALSPLSFTSSRLETHFKSWNIKTLLFQCIMILENKHKKVNNSYQLANVSVANLLFAKCWFVHDCPAFRRTSMPLLPFIKAYDVQNVTKVPKQSWYRSSDIRTDWQSRSTGC